MLKKLLIVAGIVAVAAAALTAGAVFAQTPTPPDPAGPGYGPGRFGSGSPMMGGGRMGGYGRGMMGALQPGWMHAAMLDAFAQALDMDRAVLEERLTAGETMFQIATAEGLTRDEFLAVMAEARAAALAQAVEAGTITQEQADAMATRMGRMQSRMGNGAGPGNCPMHPAAPAP